MMNNFMGISYKIRVPVALLSLFCLGIFLATRISSEIVQSSQEFKEVSKILVEIVSTSSSGVNRVHWNKLRKDLSAAIMDYKISKKRSNEEVMLLDKILANMKTVNDLWAVRIAPVCTNIKSEKCMDEYVGKIQSIIEANRYLESGTASFYGRLIRLHSEVRSELSVPVEDFLGETTEAIKEYFSHHGIKI